MKFSPHEVRPQTTEKSDMSAAEHRNARASLLLREALSLLGSEAMVGKSHVAHSGDRLIRLPEVQRLTGLKRSGIYEQMQRGTFPRSVKVGPRAATWSEAAIQGWITDRLEGRNA